ncbi:hypothetical protein D3C73_1378240 [compost metagenome]
MACQSASEVTSRDAAKPSLDFMASVCGTALPSPFIQPSLAKVVSGSIRAIMASA